MRLLVLIFFIIVTVGFLRAGDKPDMELDSIPPIPQFNCTDFKNNFVAPAYLGNGLIGMRPGINPLLSALTVVSGYVRDFPAEPFESLAPAPYPLKTDIRADQVSMQERPDLVTVMNQSLDMRCGELFTKMEFKFGEKKSLSIEILQFLSRTTPCLVLQELKITPDSDVEFEVEAVIDSTKKARNQLGISIVEPSRQSFSGKAGQTYVFRTIVAMVSETYHPEPQLQARRMKGWAHMLGFEQLQDRNRKAWAELWKSRVKVFGDTDAQKALDVAFFYIHSSAHSGCITGIPPFGLSRLEGYFGHIFWDMDHWIFQVVLPADPEAARAMVDYRFNGLENAKKIARIFGFQGAQYPWEAGTDGREVTPSGAHTGWAEHHVTLCVALAAWEYAVASGDMDYTRTIVWPMLREIATWIESRGEWTARGFEIHNIVGADENQEGTRNNAHMNLMCKMALKATRRCAEMIGYTSPESWEKISQAIVIPVDPKYNVVVQYDGAVPESGKERYAPGLLQLMFCHDPMEYDAISPELFKRTYEFEEELRVKLPPHPSNPLSPKSPGFTTPPFAACAAFFGDRKKAADQFRQAWEKYWVEPFGITKEYQSYKEGEYLMNHAALLQAAMFGFTGLRIREGEWNKYPATLPEKWRKIEIDRIWINGRAVKLVAEHGKKAELIPLQNQ